MCFEDEGARFAVYGECKGRRAVGDVAVVDGGVGKSKNSSTRECGLVDL